MARFIERVSDCCQHYGRFSFVPRMNFTKALIEELRLTGIKANIEEPEPVYTLSEEDLQNIAEEEHGTQLTKDEIKRAQKGIESGLGCWHDVASDAIQEVIDEREE